jgi:phosphoribosylglycinamide formyltransferase 1
MVETKLYSKSENREINMAIFASGAGSNAQRIIEHFIAPCHQKQRGVNIALIVCNNPAAGVLKISAKEKIPTIIIEKDRFNKDGYLHELKEYKIDFVVLAGFMWKVPAQLIISYPNKIINIHPALLPKYGGKNMYGNFVHQAVLKAGEKESGITIHYVDELYDHGKIIFQAKCTVDEDETVETLAKKIHALEHEHYPKVIEMQISK